MSHESDGTTGRCQRPGVGSIPTWGSVQTVEQHRESCRSHYRRNKDYYLRRNQARKQRAREIIAEAKNRPCSDCGQAYETPVMEFDHVRGVKKFTISSKVTSSPSESSLKAEIAKCDVVCANCHRLRTHSRLGEMATRLALNQQILRSSRRS